MGGHECTDHVGDRIIRIAIMGHAADETDRAGQFVTFSAADDGLAREGAIAGAVKQREVSGVVVGGEQVEVSVAIEVAHVLQRLALGMCNRGSDWSTRVNHNTLVYQYRLCYTMPLYCTGALSRSISQCRPITRAGCTSLKKGQEWVDAMWPIMPWRGGGAVVQA